jgi:DNA-binding transcriptional LysR family regulator
MDIEIFTIFCDLAQLKSFSKTAEKHLLSQSAISQQLAQLEMLYESQLIDRKKRPLELTEAGQLFYDACRDIIDRYGQFKSELTALQKSSEGRIKVGAIYSIGMHTLPEYVKKFLVKYPNVNVRIEYLDPDDVYEKVLNGEIDIGLVAVPKHDKRLEVYEMHSEPLVLVCSPKHFLANQSEVDLYKVQFERFIAFGPDVPTRIWVDSILQRYNISVQPAMEFDNIETIKRAVEINSGISILPETAIVQEIRSGTLKAVHFSNEKFTRPTGIIIRKNKILGRASQYFIALLRANAD